MDDTVDTAARSRSKVLVFQEGAEQGVRQPVAFQCCPLGLHFYAPGQVGMYRLLEFTIEEPETWPEKRHVSCVGIVAGCEFDAVSAMYRICVKFLDVPEEARESLEHLSRGAGLLCPYCENF